MQQFPIIQQGDFTGADVLKNDEWMADIANLLLCCGIDFRWLFMATMYTRLTAALLKTMKQNFLCLNNVIKSTQFHFKGIIMHIYKSSYMFMFG